MRCDDREFRRIAAMLLALAELAERAGARCAAIRCLVLWFLRPAQAVAFDYAVEAGAPLLRCYLAPQADAAPGEAARLAEAFRALAAMFNVLAHRARYASRAHEKSVCGKPARLPGARPVAPGGMAAWRPRLIDSS